MASTYSPLLRTELPGKGEQTGTWDVTLNRNIGTLLEHSIAGVLSLAMADANKTLTTVNGNTDQARYAVIVATGAMTAQRDIIAPAVAKTYIIRNATTGGYGVRIKTSGGVAVTVAPSTVAWVFCDGTDFYLAQVPVTLTSGDVTTALGFTPYNATNPSGYLTSATAASTYAPIASPTFTGVPLGPTASPGTNTTQIATTAFVTAAVAAATAGVATFNGRTGTVTLTSGDVTTALTYTPANIASPTFTGVPAAPTATPGTNTTQLATTAFVTAAVAASGVTSFNTRTGAVTLTSGDVTTALTFTPANIASPTFTGVPAAPTATPGTNTTQLATTAFVTAAVAGAGVTSFNTRTGAVTLSSGDVTTALGFTPYNNTNPSGYITSATAAATYALKTNATFSGSFTNTSGDIYCYGYNADNSQGLIRFNSTGTRYLFWNNSVYTLAGAGLTVGGNVTATDYGISSDLRLKTDVSPIYGALDTVDRLNGYQYTLKKTGKRRPGFIAQEVQRVLPDLVLEGDDGMLTLVEAPIIALLVEAVKELRLRVEVH